MKTVARGPWPVARIACELVVPHMEIASRASWAVGRWTAKRRFGSMALATVAVALLGVAAGGCGYRLVGTGDTGTIPKNLQKLHIAPFVNKTSRAELDQRLTGEVSQEWVRRGRFQLVSDPDQADVVLSGSITVANITPVRFDDQGRASEYQLSVAADVSFVDRTGEKPVVLWRDQRFTRVISYDVDASSANYFDREVQAIERLARDFARGLVVTILEGF
jgi:outer membrane lipopolysaccharide assembly protein LptE/RlpB